MVIIDRTTHKINTLTGNVASYQIDQNKHLQVSNSHLWKTKA